MENQNRSMANTKDRLIIFSLTILAVVNRRDMYIYVYIYTISDEILHTTREKEKTAEGIPVCHGGVVSPMSLTVSSISLFLILFPVNV